MEKKEKVVILGAGIGGLSAGYFLAKTGKYEVTVLEKASAIGGLCASFEYNDFTLDYGAHKIYSVIPGVLDEIQTLMADRLLTLPKKNRLYLRGHLVDYPLKLGNLAGVLGLPTFLKLGIGYAFELARGFVLRRQPNSYEEYMVQRFGRPAYELVFEPLADKVWGEPATLHPEMARARVPASGGMEVILKLLGIKKETAETNAEFFYYPEKGFGDFPETMREYIENSGGRVISNTDVRELVQGDGRITSVKSLVDGSDAEFETDYLVSSIPLPVLSRLMFGQAATEFIGSVEDLQFRHLVLVYVFANRSLALEDQWIFLPEREYIFSRVFEQKQMNPELGPENQTAICCDFTCDEDSWQWNATDEELAQKTVDGLVEAGFINADEVSGYLVKRTRNFYPRYDLEYVEKMKKVNNQLQSVSNLLLTGRIGMYNYNNSDHCVDMGRFIAENLAQGDDPVDIWNNLEKRVADYKIVD
ncbi:MAG: FAD-dependent oxidoreductase [Anaerolineales bacterium]|nr:FAD-dependent oxidoreductase [Chloroflexota bacterium]MBL6979886.1 FAD-dependent oxidoreductase [Anaerolineales bacterium]